jgi:hypothetical protein
MELTYENMMAVAKKYCDQLPGLIPQTKHEHEAILTPDCVCGFPETHADHVVAHWQTYRAYLYYEPWPCYIMIDERKKMANCVLKEQCRHPSTGEPVKHYENPWTGKMEDTFYMFEHFEFTLHEGQVKIKTVYVERINEGARPWQRFRDLAKHSEEGIEEGLNYDNIMALTKKYCDIMPGLIPDTKHLMDAILAPDYVGQHVERHGEHVSEHWKEYRAYLYYEPWPMYILVDERKKMADCVFKEEALHPVTGELVKAFPNPLTGEMEDTIYMCEHFEFIMHDGQPKIKNVLPQRINPDRMGWQRFRDLVKH